MHNERFNILGRRDFSFERERFLSQDKFSSSVVRIIDESLVTGVKM